MKNVVLLAFAWLVVMGCASPRTEKAELSNEWASVDLEYAKRFRIFQNESGYKVEILPIDSIQISQTFFIGSMSNADLAAPPTKGLVFSTPHFGYLGLLGQLNTVVGVESMDYVYSGSIWKRYQEGKITELGTSGNLSVEKAIALEPDFISLSGGDAPSREMEKLKKSGIPVLPVLGWKESHPLGRAEWIKFFGCVFNQMSTADSVFQEVKAKYNATKEKATGLTERVEYLFGYNYKGTWFLPGGKSYLSKLVKDAGGSYKYSDNDQSGSLQYSMEAIMSEFLHADVWLSPGSCTSKEDMLALDKKYALYAPFRNNRVYNYTKRQKPGGGNDYWESSPSMPHKVLEDLYIINQNGNDSGLFYFQRLR